VQPLVGENGREVGDDGQELRGDGVCGLGEGLQFADKGIVFRGFHVAVPVWLIAAGAAARRLWSSYSCMANII